MQEAVFRNGALITGVFRLSGGGRHYNFWRTAAEFKGNPNLPADTFLAESFAIKPRKPTPVDCVETYNRERQIVAADSSAGKFVRRHWERFHLECQRLQTGQDGIDEFKNRGGDTRMTFNADVDFAAEVLRLSDDIESLVSGNDADGS